VETPLSNEFQCRLQNVGVFVRIRQKIKPLWP
jgi:hypothetical protein